VGFSIVMVLYITLLVYGVATMRSVAEEKTTRIIEILASSVRPFHLLAGKILGVAAVGFTQYLIWGACGALISGYGSAMASAVRPGASMPNIHVPASLLVYAIIFFVVSYLLYASLYAALGAMVSSEEEMQQVQLPVTLIIVVAFILYPVVIRDANSTTSVIISMIPFFAPILMVLRIALQTPPFWQIALCLLISLLTTLGIVQISSKIYRVGILMYGKRPSVVELLRWLKYT
jgi:ABC-2 type transport system permease protein